MVEREKKPQKSSRRDEYSRGDSYEREENINKNGLVQHMSNQDIYSIYRDNIRTTCQALTV